MGVLEYTTTSLPTPNSSTTGLGLSLEVPVPPVMKYLAVALCSLACVAGVIGNVLVILAIARTKKLRTSANSFLASLAVADLGSCLLILPLIAIAFVSLETIVSHHLLCRVFYLTIFAFSPVSLEHLTLIAVNRFILISKSPRAYVKIFNRRSIPTILAVLWAGNIAVNIAFSLSAYRVTVIKGKEYCWYQQNNAFTLGFQMFSLLYAFTSCFGFIPALYVLTFRTVHKSHIRVSHEHSVTNTQSVAPGDGGSTTQHVQPTDRTAEPRGTAANRPYDSDNDAKNHGKSDSTKNAAMQSTDQSKKQRSHLSSSEIKIIKVNFVIFLTNLLFLLPLMILLVANYGSLSHAEFVLLLFPIGLNSAANPLVYCGFNRNFRRAFKALLRW